MAADKRKQTEPDAAGSAGPDKIVSYKGFDKDLRCRGFQFEVGKTYTVEGNIKACSHGFHACENPFDVLSYYDLVGSRFAVVEQTGALDRHDNDPKIASASITIKAELTLPEFIRRGVDWLLDFTKGKGDDPSGDGAQIGSSGDGARIGSSGNYARIGSSGDGARIGSSGNYARIGSSGYGAQIGSSGDGAQIGSSGNLAQIGSSGYGAQIGSSGEGAQIGSSGLDARIGSSGLDARIGSSGNYAQIGSSGDYARIRSSGDYAQIGSSGNYARIKATGEHSVIAAAGRWTQAKADQGTWISLAEYNDDGQCIGFATGCIGLDGLKPDTLYQAKGGKLVEVEG